MKDNMTLKKCMIIYLRGKVRLFLLLCVFVLIFALVLFLYDVPPDAVAYASLLCAVIGAICLAFDFSGFYRHTSALTRARADIATTLASLPPARGASDPAYEDLIKTLYTALSDMYMETTAARNYMQDYYAMWVHQIKVPISAMHMLLQDQSKSSPLNIQLFSIEQYVEMALSYVRLGSDHTDYVIREYRLDDMVKQAVRKYAPLFISKKLSLNIEDTDITVNTDEKWMCFVIEQILSNSLKYTKEGGITISYRRPATLVIRDSGIGIAPEDIPRITEKGFTGYNGRAGRKSTGIGLYLCSEILSRLHHTMKIESEVGVGTTVYIDMETRRTATE